MAESGVLEQFQAQEVRIYDKDIDLFIDQEIPRLVRISSDSHEAITRARTFLINRATELEQLTDFDTEILVAKFKKNRDDYLPQMDAINEDKQLARDARLLAAFLTGSGDVFDGAEEFRKYKRREYEKNTSDQLHVDPHPSGIVPAANHKIIEALSEEVEGEVFLDHLEAALFEEPEWGTAIEPAWADDKPAVREARILDDKQNTPDDLLYPYEQLPKRHWQRRAHRIGTPEGNEEMAGLILESPQFMSTVLGNLLIRAGVFFRRHGLDREDVTRDVVVRFMQDFSAAALTQQGVRPDPSLRVAGQIKNTYFKPVAVRQIALDKGEKIIAEGGEYVS